MIPIQVSGAINNILGSFTCPGIIPTAGTKSLTFYLDMLSKEIKDTTNWVRLIINADFGAGYKTMISMEWNGSPNQVAPSLPWTFSIDHPPLVIQGVIENGTRGAGSPAAINKGFMSFV